MRKNIMDINNFNTRDESLITYNHSNIRKLLFNLADMIEEDMNNLISNELTLEQLKGLDVFLYFAEKDIDRIIDLVDYYKDAIYHRHKAFKDKY